MTERIPAATKLGPVHLTVSDLARSLDYYQRTLGLAVLDHGDTRARLGTSSRTLLVLDEVAGARPADGYAGLFHFALLVPTRIDLARWLAHAARERHPLTGLSDHYVSEAAYLRDPDHHGIEIYADRPRELWEGQIAERMTTGPLDPADLFALLDDPATEPFDGLASGATMGHVHLRVADVDRSITFYRDHLGFELTAALHSAAFVSAGGYHHHVAANDWESRGRPQPPEGAATLRQVTIQLPDRDSLDRVADTLSDAGAEPRATASGFAVLDPSGNPLELQLADPDPA